MTLWTSFKEMWTRGPKGGAIPVVVEVNNRVLFINYCFRIKTDQHNKSGKWTPPPPYDFPVLPRERVLTLTFIKKEQTRKISTGLIYSVSLNLLCDRNRFLLRMIPIRQIPSSGLDKDDSGVPQSLLLSRGVSGPSRVVRRPRSDTRDGPGVDNLTESSLFLLCRTRENRHGSLVFESRPRPRHV